MHRLVAINGKYNKPGEQQQVREITYIVLFLFLCFSDRDAYACSSQWQAQRIWRQQQVREIACNFLVRFVLFSDRDAHACSSQQGTWRQHQVREICL